MFGMQLGAAKKALNRLIKSMSIGEKCSLTSVNLARPVVVASAQRGDGRRLLQYDELAVGSLGGKLVRTWAKSASESEGFDARWSLDGDDEAMIDG
jgi:hypothetical protein